jgi:acyl-CoA thioester hydrolase
VRGVARDSNTSVGYRVAMPRAKGQLRPIPTDLNAYACHTPIEVRFRDLDAMGHVNNAVFFTYFEIGRETYMETAGYAKSRLTPGPPGSVGRDSSTGNLCFESASVALRPRKEGNGDIHSRFPFILAEISCRYLRPVQLGETVTIHIRVDRLGTTSWGFQYLLTTSDNQAVATGASTQVFYDYSKGCPQKLPDSFVEAVAERDQIPVPP